MKYYVYVHKIKSTGEIFYVGKGSGNRLNSTYSRNKRWNEITSANEWIAEIYKGELSEEDALKVEYEIINDPSLKLCNSRKAPDVINVLSKEQLQNEFYYDETSPTGLRWSNYGHKHNRKDIAGYIVKSKNKSYFTVKFNGKQCLVHRIIWALTHDDLRSDLVINHKDGNGLNNSIDNLEQITQQQNSAKTFEGKKVGVCEMTVDKHTYAKAQWRINGKTYSKLYSYAKLGKEKAWELAYTAREEALSSINF